MAGYDKILVSTDFSEPSLAAVRHAAQLARRLGSKVFLTYVVEDRLPPMIEAHATDSPEKILERHQERATQALDDCAAANLQDVDAECVVRLGSPHDQIVELASELGVGLIVVGMHGHGFIKHALAGSTAERVLHAAPCPVLVVGINH